MDNIDIRLLIFFVLLSSSSPSSPLVLFSLPRHQRKRHARSYESLAADGVHDMTEYRREQTECCPEEVAIAAAMFERLSRGCIMLVV